MLLFQMHCRACTNLLHMQVKSARQGKLVKETAARHAAIRQFKKNHSQHAHLALHPDEENTETSNGQGAGQGLALSSSYLLNQLMEHPYYQMCTSRELPLLQDYP